jgi:hypothetical protein
MAETAEFKEGELVGALPTMCTSHALQVACRRSRTSALRGASPLTTPAAGWKYRNALVLGHVKAIKRVNVEVTPMNPEKQGSTVVRHPDKLMHASDIAKEDLEEAQRQGGHSACTGRPSRHAGVAA